MCDDDMMLYVCKKCKEKYHNEEDDGHYPLTISNSPRTGICSYEDIYPLEKLF